MNDWLIVRTREGGIEDQITLDPSWYATNGFMIVHVSTHVPELGTFCAEQLGFENMRSYLHYLRRLTEYASAKEVDGYAGERGFEYYPDTTAKSFAAAIWGVYTEDADESLRGIRDAESLYETVQNEFYPECPPIELAICLCRLGRFGEAARTLEIAMYDHPLARKEGIKAVAENAETPRVLLQRAREFESGERTLR